MSGLAVLSTVFIWSVCFLREDTYWLGKNIYYEARDEGFEGWLAVTNVTINRGLDGRWPNTIKGVVTAGTERGIKCDFSWYCDGLPDTPKLLQNKLKLQGFYLVAGGFLSLDVLGLLPDNTKGAHSYQRKELQDEEGWFGLLEPTVVINNHRFYKDKAITLRD
jgi:hypothetical protein